MRDARVTVPMLRQKTIEATSDEPGAPVRVRLALQDDLMDELRVLVESDRLLTDQAQDLALVDIEVDTGDRAYHPVARVERRLEAADPQDGSVGVLGRQRFNLGSIASRSPSPRRLKPSWRRRTSSPM